jgi:hypothetical protein
MRRTRAAILLLTCCATTPARSQPLPQGPQFQVNVHSTNEQYQSSVSALADGGFFVVWESFGSSGNDFSGFSVQGRRFAADGTPDSPGFQVNTTWVGYQRLPDVASVSGGSVVVWQGPDPSGVGTGGIFGQRFALDGAPTGPEFMLSGSVTLPEVLPAIAALDDGGFVVSWDGRYACLTDFTGGCIFARRYGADGGPEGPAFEVNSYITGYQRRSDVAGLADGGFVVVWESTHSGAGDTSSYSVQGQRFAADSSPAGGQFQVNTYTTGMQGDPAVAALANGGFVVVWHSEGSGGDDSDLTSVQAQRFGSDGSPAGGQFQINVYTTSSQFRPSVSPVADGGFVVAWVSGGSYGSDTSFSSVQARWFAADGTPESTQFQVNTYTTSFQTDPAIGVTPGDGLVVAWSSDGSAGGDSSEWSVQAQRYRRAIFADGFEDGTTDAWSPPEP